MSKTPVPSEKPLHGWQHHVVKVPKVSTAPYQPRGGEAWCGYRIPSYEWYFLDPGHAIHTIADGDRLSPCPACVQAMLGLLQALLQSAIDLGYAESWADALARLGAKPGDVVRDDDGNCWIVRAGGWPEGLGDADTIPPAKLHATAAPPSLHFP